MIPRLVEIKVLSAASADELNIIMAKALREGYNFGEPQIHEFGWWVVIRKYEWVKTAGEETVEKGVSNGDEKAVQHKY